MGVKSLWNLLAPVGRPVLLETVEGKVMAIDSSIWIYQFQATMRDSDGRALLNAHVLGFLRRISKLLFYGIKPVFVFDGGAPALKRTTLRERREKKSGAAANHAKLAEKLLAAQMRREALDQVHVTSSQSSKARGPRDKGSAAGILAANTVYLEDIDSSVPKTPARPKRPAPLSSGKAKSKSYDHDPYRLPEIDLEEAVAKATQSIAPDPRLATEDELRAFIEDLRPEEFDVTSPTFRDLPTEVQYEIVGDLRLKSRQTSYARLQNMLKSAPTPLDFSKQQIKNLQQRNTLTQQLLITTDSIGSAHISIPVRIASERNKEYILMKNEGESGGWILGIRDHGTKQKPIEIDQDEDEARDTNEDSDADMEEVHIEHQGIHDSDLRQYQQQMALSAIGSRASKQLPSTIVKGQKPKLHRSRDEDSVQIPLFDESSDDNEDETLAFAVQASFDNIRKTQYLPQAQPLSLKILSGPTESIGTTTQAIVRNQSQYEEDSIFSSQTRLQTALSIANAGPPRTHLYSSLPDTTSMSFGSPTLLPKPISKNELSSVAGPSKIAHSVTSTPTELSADTLQDPQSASDSEEDMEEIPLGNKGQNSLSMESTSAGTTISVHTTPPSPLPNLRQLETEDTAPHRSPLNARGDDEGPNMSSHNSLLVSPMLVNTVTSPSRAPVPPPPIYQPEAGPSQPHRSPNPQGESSVSWFPTLSPLRDPTSDPSLTHQTWDDLEEMEAHDEDLDLHAEEGEFARFISEVKGKDIKDVRREIDDEIKLLNQQRKAAIRDSEDITQQMIAQIMNMLRLFGIPYITAPMEAEAQCAELVSLGLVDGVITDDSDVFLFGAQRVFKNMFNQSKTVECFLLSDLERDLGLDRDKLIRLAYLLGSDYVDGLPGVGPVVAMELLNEFPGHDGLHKFKNWWLRVQTGKDKEEENKSKFRKQFKRRFKDLYLPTEWPNTEVKDAYYHPTVDTSEEPFKWGLPDLDALRTFLQEELGWAQAKSDEILLPIVQKMNKRGQTTAQGNLNGYFEVTAGSGTHAPRHRQAYASKRLQNVVNAHRKEQKRAISPTSSLQSPSQSDGEDEARRKSVKRQKKAVGVTTVKRKPQKTASNTRSRGRGRGGTSRGQKTRAPRSDTDEFQADDDQEAVVIPLDPAVVARLRPRPKPAYRGAREDEAEPI